MVMRRLTLCALLLLLCTIPALWYGAASQSSIVIIHLAASLIFFFLLLQKYITQDFILINIDFAKPLLIFLVIKHVN